MITPAQANQLRLQHENAVWQAIQTSGEGNPPSSQAGAATAQAMQLERATYNAFAANPTPALEADFMGAHRNTAARFQAWKGRPIDPNASNLAPAAASSTGTAATVAGVSVPLLLVGGAALWYFLKKRKKGGGGKQKLFGLL